MVRIRLDRFAAARTQSRTLTTRLALHESRRLFISIYSRFDECDPQAKRCGVMGCDPTAFNWKLRKQLFTEETVDGKSAHRLQSAGHKYR